MATPVLATPMLSYDNAMAVLIDMFPAIDSQTIDQQLRLYGGNMERTVTALLELQQPVRSNIRTSRTQQSTQQSQRSHINDTSKPCVMPHMLPDEFLRPPSWFKQKQHQQQQQLQARNGAFQNDTSTDRSFAEALQDQNFMRELAQRPQTYRQNHSQSSARPSSLSANMFETDANVNTGLHSTNHKSTFTEKWKSLSSAAKQRLLQLAGRLKSKKYEKPQAITLIESEDYDPAHFVIDRDCDDVADTDEHLEQRQREHFESIAL